MWRRVTVNLKGNMVFYGINNNSSDKIHPEFCEAISPKFSNNQTRNFSHNLHQTCLAIHSKTNFWFSLRFDFQLAEASNLVLVSATETSSSPVSTDNRIFMRARFSPRGSVKTDRTESMASARNSDRIDDESSENQRSVPASGAGRCNEIR